MREHSQPAEILLIEDNPGDVELIREALQSGRVLNHISLAVDGEDAMAFLNRKNSYAAAPRPDLILLDLNLPKKNGFEVLERGPGKPALESHPGDHTDQFASRPGHSQRL